ncbi:hypothetical protein F7725_008901 [Dissostichus mawsoni]|uniref:Uncharacterized protein n=1 Tax=Dissostichus mawsoni TaxID=36200 RepID=A0A7J5Z5D4_DISMA|nr:hypothetical protein F7725_008901 [Dissostichus mawsoni]
MGTQCVGIFCRCVRKGGELQREQAGRRRSTASFFIVRIIMVERRRKRRKRRVSLRQSFEDGVDLLSDCPPSLNWEETLLTLESPPPPADAPPPAANTSSSTGSSSTGSSHCSQCGGLQASEGSFGGHVLATQVLADMFVVLSPGLLVGEAAPLQAQLPGCQAVGVIPQAGDRHGRHKDAADDRHGNQRGEHPAGGGRGLTRVARGKPSHLALELH